jgi:hypothetical protein
VLVTHYQGSSVRRARSRACSQAAASAEVGDKDLASS